MISRVVPVILSGSSAFAPPLPGPSSEVGSPPASGNGVVSAVSGLPWDPPWADDAVRTSCVVMPVVPAAGLSPAESHMRPAGLSNTGVPSLSRATKPPSAVGAMSRPVPETFILIVASAGFLSRLRGLDHEY